MNSNSSSSLKFIAGIVLVAGIISGIYAIWTSFQDNSVFGDLALFVGILIIILTLIPAGILWGIADLIVIASDIRSETKDTNTKVEDIFCELHKNNIKSEN